MSRRLSIAGIIAALSIAAMAVGIFYLRGGSTPVPVDDAVERFRTTTTLAHEPVVRPEAPKRKTADSTRVAQATQRRSPTTERHLRARPLPTPGVYVYATKGGDRVDVLGGSSHTYPERTTVTVRHDGCGLVERWDALDERWDERETCRTPKGDALKRFTSYHEFFRHADERTYSCTGLAYPEGAKPGDTWTSRCVSGESVASQTGRAVGIETLRVGTKKVRTLRVRVDTKLTGEQEGSGSHEVWGDLATGLSIRERVITDSYSVQPVFGRTHYHESYEINLTSLEPRK